MSINISLLYQKKKTKTLAKQINYLDLIGEVKSRLDDYPADKANFPLCVI